MACMCGCPASEPAAGSREENADQGESLLHLHHIGIQMVAENPKSEFIVARKSIILQ